MNPKRKIPIVWSFPDQYLNTPLFFAEYNCCSPHPQVMAFSSNAAFSTCGCLSRRSKIWIQSWPGSQTTDISAKITWSWWCSCWWSWRWLVWRSWWSCPVDPKVAILGCCCCLNFLGERAFVNTITILIWPWFWIWWCWLFGCGDWGCHGDHGGCYCCSCSCIFVVFMVCNDSHGSQDLTTETSLPCTGCQRKPHSEKDSKMSHFKADWFSCILCTESKNWELSHDEW